MAEALGARPAAIARQRYAFGQASDCGFERVAQPDPMIDFAELDALSGRLGVTGITVTDDLRAPPCGPRSSSESVALLVHFLRKVPKDLMRWST